MLDRRLSEGSAEILQFPVFDLCKWRSLQCNLRGDFSTDPAVSGRQQEPRPWREGSSSEWYCQVLRTPPGQFRLR